jgi:hypothetical protein
MPCGTTKETAPAEAGLAGPVKRLRAEIGKSALPNADGRLLRSVIGRPVAVGYPVGSEETTSPFPVERRSVVPPCCSWLRYRRLSSLLSYTHDGHHVRGAQGRYFVLALRVAAIFIAAVINRELPRGMPRRLRFPAQMIAGITIVEESEMFR